MENSLPIDELVGSFLESALSVISSNELMTGAARAAELSYELDVIVSDFLDQHGLPSHGYDEIYREVVNAIAYQLDDPAFASYPLVAFDDHGSVGFDDIVTFVDCCSSDL